MKRLLVSLAILTFLISTISTSNLSTRSNSFPVSPTMVIYVPDNYSKIRDAVDKAPEGSVIVVRDGFYIDNIAIWKPLHIVSENGPSRTIIWAADPNKPALIVAASNVTISGFTIAGSAGASGILLAGVKYCRIFNNNIIGNHDGIQLDGGSSNNTIAYNIIAKNSDKGVLLNIRVTDNVVVYNNIFSNYIGVFQGGLRSIVAYNSIVNNTHGVLQSMYPSSSLIVYNSIVGNNNGIQITGPPGDLSLISSIIAYNNVTSNNVGISILGRGTNYIVYNNITDNAFIGIMMEEPGINTVEYNTIAYNNIINSIIGIELTKANNNTIAYNNIIGGRFAGIELLGSSNNTIAYNNIVNNDRGLSIAEIYTMPGNRFYPTRDNRIYLNNFINNNYSVIIGGITPSGAANIWNTAEEVAYVYRGKNYTGYLGNYWSDYRGSDSNGDGIGDAPYVINSNNTDYYPLIDRFDSYAHEQLRITVPIPTYITISIIPNITLPIAATTASITTVTVTAATTTTSISTTTVTMPITITSLITTTPAVSTTTVTAPGRTVTVSERVTVSITTTSMVSGQATTITITAFTEAREVWSIITEARTVTVSLTAGGGAETSVWAVSPLAIFIVVAMIITLTIYMLVMIRKSRRFS